MSGQAFSFARNRWTGLAGFLAVTSFAVQVLPVSAQVAADAISQEIRNVYDQCNSAIVRVEGRDERGKLLGTGFFIDPDGTLFTSYTLAAESEDLEVLFEGQRLPATKLMADPRSGVALLKVEATTPFLMTGKSSDLGVASPVMLIGYPMDFNASPAFGVVSGFEMKYKGRYFTTAHIRASIPVEGGQGGAPLLNLKGEVVGIVISSAVGGGSCFSLPIEAAEKVRRDFVRFGEPRPGYLGAELMTGEGTEDSAPQVQRVDTTGPAASAGVQSGDVILELAGRPVHAPEDVINAAFYISSGDDVPVVLLRHGERVSVVVKATERPTQPPKFAAAAQDSPGILRVPGAASGTMDSNSGPSLGGTPQKPADQELHMAPNP